MSLEFSFLGSFSLFLITTFGSFFRKDLFIMISTFVFPNVFVLPLWLKHSCAENVSWQLFSGSTLKILFHSFLASLIAMESLTVICGSFFLVAFKIFPLLLVFCSFTKMYQVWISFYLFFLAYVVLPLSENSCFHNSGKFWAFILDVDFFHTFFLSLSEVCCGKALQVWTSIKHFQWSCYVVRSRSETATVMQRGTTTGPLLDGMVPLCKLEKTPPSR